VEFEWNDDKGESNLKEHGIDFIRAKEIWAAGARLETIETRKGENRLVTIGKLGRRTIFVAYTWRKGVCRIISARPASRKERKHYQDALGRRLD
jgi:uncharacterized DUF497 family protein